MDTFLFSVGTFSALGIALPLGGPYTSGDWAKHLRTNGKSVSEFLIYLVQFLFLFERIAGGVGFWFFLLADWSDWAYFVAISALFVSYLVFDFYCWPSLYFYPVENRNYIVTAAVYGFGWVCMVVAWILMIVKRAYTTAWAFWAGFSLMAVASLLGVALAIALWYAHRGYFYSARGRAPTLARR